MSQVKVFVSSTCYDLKQIRVDMYNFISDMGFHPILSEYPSFPIDPQKDIKENCIENVRSNTDIFILIVGSRYGAKIDSEKSITNAEYIAAKELGIPTYIFILKSITSILPIWMQNKEADYSQTVDSPQLLEFAYELRSNKKDWCFEFESAQDIISTLKNQFSFLIKNSLDLRRKYQESIPEIYSLITKQALEVLLNKEDMYEILFFAQVLEDELQNYEQLKLDLDYNIILGAKERVKDKVELEDWLSRNLSSLTHYIDTSNSILSNIFPKYFGEVGTPSDLKGLYYVAKAFSRLYADMVKWSIDVKSTSVEEEYQELRDSFAQYTVKTSQHIWDYPRKVKSDINDGLQRIKNGEPGPIKITTTLHMEIDESASNEFNKQMNRILNG